MSDITLNLHDKESIVALMVDVQEAEISCRRAATEIQERHYAAMDALNAANEKMRERLKVSDELADGLIAELDNLKASTGPTETLNQTARKLERERDQWRRWAERVARCIRVENKLRPLLFSADFEAALAEFDRLMEVSK